MKINQGWGITLEHFFNLIKKIPKKFRKQLSISTSKDIPLFLGYNELNEDLEMFFEKNNKHYQHLLEDIEEISDFIVKNEHDN